MKKNKIVSLTDFRKKRLLGNNALPDPSVHDVSTCSLCSDQLELDDAFGQCCACRETQQAALRAYGLWDELEEDPRQ